jgi:hypothetical protein
VTVYNEVTILREESVVSIWGRVMYWLGEPEELQKLR